MQYLGGKSRSGKRIATELTRWRQPGQLFVDVCCGALNVTRHMVGPRTAIDNCRPLMIMWQALQRGWDPPYITEEMYDRIKANPDPDDPVTALALFGCSYGGKWAQSYARPRPTQDYPRCAVNQALAKIADCADVDFRCADYRQIANAGGALVYVDPPYEGVCGYGYSGGEFDHAEFWRVALGWGPYVFVSEGAGACPGEGWALYAEWSVDGTVGARTTGRRVPQVERLYVPQDSPMAASRRTAQSARSALDEYLDQIRAMSKPGK